ncbi:transcriptional regulator, TetR family [Desulfacinum hydrothermale DSM 13146]|uniref:Transcriptional regulator, TetR family n=1 Tax=Desulfacinum hydrothermale DSM 13146 TaxID=1121390 RepID=A0A1W1X9R6_9BACT|nr:TetR/AcrR family transcriptional regulator [Desulfacinum hydrothermale]SMC20271.1 transcriptional regulator, TetR family [Desulfacinum hydrothermale DSM 13146]
MTEKPLSRRQREMLRYRQEVLQAALQLFSARGYDRVSMRQIAEKAEFSVGTLYNLFKNKEDIYRAIIVEVADRFETAARGALQGSGNPLERIRAFIAACARVVEENSPAIRLYLSLTRGMAFHFKAGFDEEVQERDRRILQLLASVLEEGGRAGLLRYDLHPDHLALALDGLLGAFLLRCMEEGAGCRPEIYSAVVEEVFLKGALAVDPSKA